MRNILRKNETLPERILKAEIFLSFGPLLLLMFAYGSQQFGYMPCKICIEIRFFLWCAALIGLASLCFERIKKALCVAGTLFIAAAAGFGLYLTLIEYGVISQSSCTPFTFYHNYLPLHDIWPGMFEVQGMCGISENLIGPFSYSLASYNAIVALLSFMIILNRKIKD